MREPHAVSHSHLGIFARRTKPLGRLCQMPRRDDAGNFAWNDDDDVALHVHVVSIALHYHLPRFHRDELSSLHHLSAAFGNVERCRTVAIKLQKCQSGRNAPNHYLVPSMQTRIPKN
ncbi:unnamed protein product [Ixodes pacificus]